MNIDIERKYLQGIFDHILEGLIIMRANRQIIMINPASKVMLSFDVCDYVGYCSYCKSRQVPAGEQKCYLIVNQEVPTFLSEMPTYQGNAINVEMSTAGVFRNEDTGETEYLL